MAVIFEIKEGNEYLTSYSGLSLMGALLRRTKLKDRLDQIRILGCAEPEISHSDMIYSMLGLLSLSKTDFQAIEPFRDDEFFRLAIGIDRCPSSSALRQRLDLVRGAFDITLKEELADLIGCTAPGITTLKICGGEFAALDIEVSPFDNSKTSKEGVSRTYKGFDGYAPIFAYLGQEGYLINAELREGKQHCQLNTPEFLEESINYAVRMTEHKLLLRMDAGNDSLDNIKVCMNKGVGWIIKRNLRRESKQKWLSLAGEQGVKTTPREGKTVWRGATTIKAPELERELRIVYEVIERNISAKGQVLVLPDIEVNTYWVSLSCSPDEAILLYQAHGESEQFHSELKSDMDLERFPSRYFETNSLILLLGMAAYNMLRLCGQESLREDNGAIEQRPGYRRKAGRRRIRTVIQDLMYMACRVISHARKWFLSFGRCCPWVNVWKLLYLRFLEPVGASP